MTARAARPTDLVHQLVKLRYAQGLTQRDVAARMNISCPAVSMIETGRRGRTLAVLLAYAAAIGAQLTATALPTTCVVEGCCNPEHEARAS